MNDKIIGVVMIVGSLSVLGFLFYWTVLMPILWPERFYEAYLGLSIVFFVIAFIVLIFLAWIGRVFLKTRAPKEGMLESRINNNENSEIVKEKVKNNEFLGIGTAKISGSLMKEMTKGVAVSTRKGMKEED